MDGYGGDASDAIPRVPRRGPPAVPAASSAQQLQATVGPAGLPQIHAGRPRSWDPRAPHNPHGPPHKRIRTGPPGEHHGHSRRGGSSAGAPPNFRGLGARDHHDAMYNHEEPPMPDPASAAAACAAAAAAAGMGHHPIASGHAHRPPPDSSRRTPITGTVSGVSSHAGPPTQSGVPADGAESANAGPMSFKDFLLKQPDEISPSDAQHRYSEYVADFMKHQPSQFFDEHKDDEWFRERYHPEAVRERQARIKREVGERAVEFARIWDRCGPSACVVKLVADPSRTRGNSANRRRPTAAESSMASNQACENQNLKPEPHDVSVDIGGKQGVAEPEDCASTVQAKPEGGTVAAKDEAVTVCSKIDSCHEEERPPVSSGIAVKRDSEVAAAGAKEGGTTLAPEDARGAISLQKGESSGASVGSLPAALPSASASLGLEGARKEDAASCDDADLMSSTPKKEDPLETVSAAAKSEESSEPVRGGLDDESKVPSVSPRLLDADVSAKDAEPSSTLASAGGTSDDVGGVAKPSDPAPGEQHGAVVGKGEESTKNQSAVPEDKKLPGVSSGEPEGAIRSREDMLPLQRDVINDTIFLRNIPVRMSRRALEHVMTHGRNGDQNFKLVRFKIGEINPSRNLLRYAWAVYPDEETAAKAMEATYNATIYAKEPFLRPERGDITRNPRAHGGNPSPSDPASGKGSGSASNDAGAGNDEDGDAVYTLDTNLNVHRKRRFSSGRIMPSVSASEARISVDATQAERLMRRFDEMREVDPSTRRLTPEFLASLASNDIRLDHCICYLREVHYYCYYSGNEYLEDPTSMLPPEVRPAEVPPVPSPSSLESGARWEAKLDDRVAQLLARPYDKPRSDAEDGRELQERRLHEFFNEKTKHEGPGRFRCLLPPLKLFKGPEYVQKHIRVKHAEAVREVLVKADLEQYRINFNNDPAKEELLAIYAQGELGLAPGSEGDPGADMNSAQRLNPLESPMMGHNAIGMMPANYVMGASNMPGGSVGMYPGATQFMGMGMGMMPGMQMGVMPGMGHVPQMYATPSMMMMNNASGFQSGYQQNYGMAPQSYGGPMQGAMPSSKGSDGPPPRSGYGGRRSRGRGRGRARGGGGGHNSQPRLDPRARGSSRGYNDLDAPSNGSQLAYDDV